LNKTEGKNHTLEDRLAI